MLRGVLKYLIVLLIAGSLAAGITSYIARTSYVSGGGTTVVHDGGGSSGFWDGLLLGHIMSGGHSHSAHYVSHTHVVVHHTTVHHSIVSKPKKVTVYKSSKPRVSLTKRTSTYKSSYRTSSPTRSYSTRSFSSFRSRR